MTRPAHPPEVVPRLLAPVTAQPAACRSSAQARPMPADAPVMSTRLAPLLMDYLIYLDGDADYPGHRLSRGAAIEGSGQAGANDPRRFACLDQARGQGQPGQVGATPASGLVPYPVQVRADRADADEQLAGDLGVAGALGDQGDQLPFPGAELPQPWYRSRWLRRARTGEHQGVLGRRGPA